MAYYEYHEKTLFGVQGFLIVGKGMWAGDINSLHLLIMQFSERNIDQRIGKHFCRFRVMTVDDKKPIATRNGKEFLWLVGTSFATDCDGEIPLVEVVKNGEVRRLYPDDPYGKVLATQTATNLRIELWVAPNDIDFDAVQVYMEKLYQQLVEDGLEPTRFANFQSTSLLSDGLRNALASGQYEGAFPPKGSLTRQICYPGEINHFKVFLKRLIDSKLASWESSNGVWLECQETFPPDLSIPVERWHIRTQLTTNPDAWATIIAYAEKASETQVCFYDGYNSITNPHKRPPIGQALQELVDYIEDQAGLSTKYLEIAEHKAFLDQSKRKLGSDHFAYPDREERRQIVEHYWKEKASGKVSNKNTWAQTNHGISGRTLLNYEKEFSEK